MNEYDQSKVGPPGIALALLGVLAILGNLLNAAWQLFAAMVTIMDLVNSSAAPEAWVAWFMSQGYGIVVVLFSACISIIVLAAGLRLRSARTGPLVYLGSILAMLPCCGVGVPCCCFGLPIGVWVIMTMQDDQVKAAFAEG